MRTGGVGRIAIMAALVGSLAACGSGAGISDSDVGSQDEAVGGAAPQEASGAGAGSAADPAAAVVPAERARLHRRSGGAHPRRRRRRRASGTGHGNRGRHGGQRGTRRGDHRHRKRTAGSARATRPVLAGDPRPGGSRDARPADAVVSGRDRGGRRRREPRHLGATRHRDVPQPAGPSDDHRHPGARDRDRPAGKPSWRHSKRANVPSTTRSTCQR